MGAEHVEPRHDDVEEQIALLLALAALGRSFQHLVVDGAQQSGDDVALGGEGAAQLRERQICALGDVEQAHLGPALLGRALERRGEDAAFPGVVIEHGSSPCPHYIAHVGQIEGSIQRNH